MMKILTICAAMWMLCGTIFAAPPVAGKNFSVSLLAYQWKKDGVNIVGATSASYTIDSAKKTDAGNYTVTVSNSAGSVTSSAAKLTVNLKKPTISTQPKSQTVTEGNDVTFTVTANGSELSYQWYMDGSPINGATSASY
ncbi:MAG: immunoglobulin domain-containing protein, partial [Verrucomicrobia bacterium]|nr:immunoglobulin domain-containing protein [Verrucomicrobiota bacterium]